ncbi:hypothetical protein SCHPADRAFT_947091 [Schizopora paradoxa]|uniref:Uncharacterized protein n=1 Tax=Schizopora paradoxa TaxID=27342 RepID=A0A0H2R0H4_9AGAM|nr:hypothetical protein SCHPADRAFT_947091 [Schizopora paradoxa]
MDRTRKALELRLPKAAKLKKLHFPLTRSFAFSSLVANIPPEPMTGKAKRGRGRPPKNASEKGVPSKAPKAPPKPTKVARAAPKKAQDAPTTRSNRKKTVPTRYKDSVEDDEMEIDEDIDGEEEVEREPPNPQPKTRNGPTPVPAGARRGSSNELEEVPPRGDDVEATEKAVRNILGPGGDTGKKASAPKRKRKGSEESDFVMDVDGDDDDSGEDEPDTIVVFKVPQKNGCLDTLEIPSRVSFDTFKFRIAEGMDVSVKKLNIGYTLSTWPQKEMPFALSKVSHLVGLFETVEKERLRLEKAAKKGNNAKDLFVKIKDLNDSKGGKGKSGNKSKPVEESDDVEANSEASPEKAEPPKKVSAAWAVELDEQLQCDRQGKEKCEYGKCWKEIDDELETIVHYPISPRNSSFWLMHLTMGKWNSILEPPPVIANKIKAEYSAKKDGTVAPTDSASQTGQHGSSNSSTVSSQSFPFPLPAIHFHAGALMNGTGTYMASPSKPILKKHPSVGSPLRLDAVPAKNFTTIHEFLASIDKEEADGGDDTNFSQYADKLVAKGYRRIHLLYDETPKTLQNDLELAISTGDAKQLLLYVKRACEGIARAAT